MTKQSKASASGVLDAAKALAAFVGKGAEKAPKTVALTSLLGGTAAGGYGGYELGKYLDGQESDKIIKAMRKNHKSQLEAMQQNMFENLTGV